MGCMVIEQVCSISLSVSICILNNRACDCFTLCMGEREKNRQNGKSIVKLFMAMRFGFFFLDGTLW